MDINEQTENSGNGPTLKPEREHVFGKTVVRLRIPVLVICLLLLIPSALG